MHSQYNKLGKSLFRFYCVRSIIAITIFIGSYMGLKYYFSVGIQQYQNTSQKNSYRRLINIVQTLIPTIDSIAAVTINTIQQNVTNANAIFCLSNWTSIQCSAYLNTNQLNQMQLIYNFMPYFSCRQGNCRQVSNLFDYYWTFLIRLNFISSIIIQYKANNETDQLIVPPLVSLQMPNITNYNVGQCSLVQQSNTYMMAYTNNNQNISLTIIAMLNNEVLMNQYNVDLNSFNFYPNMQMQSSNNVSYYNNQGIFMFSMNLNLPAYSIDTSSYYLGIIISSIVLIFLFLYVVNKLIKKWQITTFSRLQTLDNLYKYQLNSVFKGGKPKNTTVLSNTTLTSFYEQLSEIADKNCQPLNIVQQPTQKQEPFKFSALADRLMSKFQQQLQPLQEQRSKQLSNLKMMLKSSVNQISQNVGKKMKDLFIKARQLSLSSQFFHFGYFSLLYSIQNYQKLLRLDTAPLPQAMISLFRHMNHTINSNDIKYAYQFSFAFNHLIEQELIMKIQFNLLQKYFSLLRQLDFGMIYGKQLGLQRQLRYLQQNIQNKKYLFITYLK